MNDSHGGKNMAAVFCFLFGGYILFNAWNTYSYGTFSYRSSTWTISDPLPTAIGTALFGIAFLYIGYLCLTGD